MCIVGETVKFFMTIIDQSMSTVMIQKKATEVPTLLICGWLSRPEQCKMFILMINQAMSKDGLVNLLLCHMQCCLNGVHISKVPNFWLRDQVRLLMLRVS